MSDLHDRELREDHEAEEDQERDVEGEVAEALGSMRRITRSGRIGGRCRKRTIGLRGSALTQDTMARPISTIM